MGNKFEQQFWVNCAAICISYLGIGAVQEWIIQIPHYNSLSQQNQYFEPLIGFILIPTFIIYAISSFFNFAALSTQNSEACEIPKHMEILLGFMVSLSTLSTVYAIYYLTFPIVMVFKFMTSLFVYFFQSFGFESARRNGSQLQLTIGRMAAIFGVLIFFWNDQELQSISIGSEIFTGFLVLLVSLITDAALPFVQKSLKNKYKFNALQLQLKVNNWVCAFGFLSAVVSMQIFDILYFFLTHHSFAFLFVALALLTLLGQVCVYQMAAEESQQKIRLMTSLRKVGTLVLSFVLFGHSTNIGQFIGLFVIVLFLEFQFYSKNQDKEAAEQYPMTDEMFLASGPLPEKQRVFSQAQDSIPFVSES